MWSNTKFMYHEIQRDARDEDYGWVGVCVLVLPIMVLLDILSVPMTVFGWLVSKCIR